MLLMLYLLRENSPRDRFTEFYQEEIEWHSEKESCYTHDVLRDKENDKNDWCRDIERFTNEAWIQEISLNHMNKRKHDNDCDDDTPTSVCRYTSKKYRYTTDKYSQNWDKAG